MQLKEDRFIDRDMSYYVIGYNSYDTIDISQKQPNMTNSNTLTNSYNRYQTYKTFGLKELLFV